MKQYLAQHWRTYLGFFAAILVVQVTSSLVTFTSVTTWYQSLNKPAWTPPDWVFGPVWTILYIMIAIAGARAWSALEGTFRQKLNHPAISAFIIQLFYNWLWSLLFFGLRNPLLGLIDIVMLVAALSVTILRMKKLDIIATRLLIPYLLWVLYATTLNAGIFFMN